MTVTVIEREAPVSIEVTPDFDSGKTAAEVLAGLPLFSCLDAAARERIASFTFRRVFAPGELIVEEGRTANGLFVIVKGRVNIVKGVHTDRPQVVATLGAGEPIGEMEVLAEWPRTASAVAVEATEVIGMDSWVFLDHVASEPRLTLRLAQVLAKRLATTSEQVAYLRLYALARGS
jgi:CRP-like cAMP-binding protein